MRVAIIIMFLLVIFTTSPAAAQLVKPLTVDPIDVQGITPVIPQELDEPIDGLEEPGAGTETYPAARAEEAYRVWYEEQCLRLERKHGFHHFDIPYVLNCELIGYPKPKSRQDPNRRNQTRNDPSHAAPYSKRHRAKV